MIPEKPKKEPRKAPLNRRPSLAESKKEEQKLWRVRWDGQKEEARSEVNDGMRAYLKTFRGQAEVGAVETKVREVNRGERAPWRGCVAAQRGRKRARHPIASLPFPHTGPTGPPTTPLTHRPATYTVQ